MDTLLRKQKFPGSISETDRDTHQICKRLYRELSGWHETGTCSEMPMTDNPQAAAASVVSAKKLGLTFETNDGPVHALSNVDLEVRKGDFVSFIGPSGCGKTTFLRVIADLEKKTSGDITVNGMSPEEARKSRSYGYV